MNRPEVRLLFRPRHRLRHAREFQSVFGSRLQKSAGPLVLFARPNELDHPRLGLSVGRRVGGAVLRNRVKRLLREAFRSLQHELPASPCGSYDLVLGVRPHRPLALDEYRRLIAELAAGVDREHRRRARRDDG